MLWLPVVFTQWEAGGILEPFREHIPKVAIKIFPILSAVCSSGLWQVL